MIVQNIYFLLNVVKDALNNYAKLKLKTNKLVRLKNNYLEGIKKLNISSNLYVNKIHICYKINQISSNLLIFQESNLTRNFGLNKINLL